MTHLLFVYGTLKKGYGNHDRLMHNAKFIGEAISPMPVYKMQTVAFPLVWRELNGNGARVKGEVYQIDDNTLAKCDQLEGYPRMYLRERAMFRVGAKLLIAWIYLWQGEQHYETVLPKNGILEWSRT
jgi:gamma-glutamylaminecyclotransferase